VNPGWLLAVLRQHENVDVSHETLAERIVEALPLEAITAAIRDSAGYVLACRGLDASAAREIGNNAAQTVLFALCGALDVEEAA